jgi:2-amino-4-hydroxy-6-hydroxymethyldihydropteridine diphosphokinase
MEDQIFILLGSNQGERERNLKLALLRIDQLCGAVIRKSLLYETAPWGFDSSDWFLNQVIQIKSNLSPESLLDKLLGIELELGRVRTNAQYSSRAIDLDLLYYSSFHIQTKSLEIPHPRLHLRRFTLLPLCDIAPDFVHPVLRKTQLELFNNLTDNSIVRKADS